MWCLFNISGSWWWISLSQIQMIKKLFYCRKFKWSKNFFTLHYWVFGQQTFIECLPSTSKNKGDISTWFARSLDSCEPLQWTGLSKWKFFVHVRRTWLRLRNIWRWSWNWLIGWIVFYMDQYDCVIFSMRGMTNNADLNVPNALTQNGSK